MKEPTDHHVFDDEYEDDTGECAKDGEEWPFKTWRKWIASKDYRIAQLEATVKRLDGQARGDSDRLRSLERTVRDDSNILRNGIFHAMTDLGKHGRMGSLDLTWTRDVQDDFRMMGSSYVTRIAGPAELTVIYKSVDGHTRTNGEVTEFDIGG